jgi:hypothetical protein
VRVELNGEVFLARLTCFLAQKAFTTVGMRSPPRIHALVGQSTHPASCCEKRLFVDGLGVS